MPSLEDRARFESLLNMYADECRAIADAHGFNLEPPTAILLMHAELSEAVEAMRGDPLTPSEHISKFSAIEEEMADVIIRVLDFSAMHGLRIGEAVTAKMDFNRSRPHKHGKKF